MDSNGLRFWMLSQLNDWLPPWRAVTAYIPGQGIVDPNGNIQIAQNAGTSDAIPPIWSTTLSQTTVDAGISWINSGPGSMAGDDCFLGRTVHSRFERQPAMRRRRSPSTERPAPRSPCGRWRLDKPSLTAM